MGSMKPALQGLGTEGGLGAGAAENQQLYWFTSVHFLHDF